MTEWKEYKLGEVCTELSDGLHKAPVFKEGGDYIFVNAKNIANGYIVDNDPTKKSTYDEFLKYSSPLNDTTILYSIDGTIGNIAIYRGEKCILGKGACYMNPNPKMLNRMYLYYELQSPRFKAYIDQMSTGSTIQHISLKTMRNYVFTCPSLSEQKSIASILSSLDDKIDLLHRENATLELMAETMFRQWFVVEAKEEWEEKELREIVDISIGRTPPRKETKWFSTNPNDVKWLSIKDMGAGDVFLFNTSEYLTKEAVETFSIPIIPNNTVVLSFKMTVGRVGITTEDMLSNEAIAHFKFTNKTPIAKEYLYLFLKSFKYDSLGSTSSIVTAINSAMIKQMQIIIPDEMIMKKFEEQTQYIFDKIYSNQKQIQTLIQMRDGLLPKLMSNEIKM